MNPNTLTQEAGETPVAQTVDRKSHLSPGRYHARIFAAKHYQHYSDDHDVIQIWMDLFDDSGNTDHQPKYYNVTSTQVREYIQSELKKIGISVSTRADMLHLPDLLEGIELEVLLSFNDQGYPAIYFLGLTKKEKEKVDPEAFW